MILGLPIEVLTMLGSSLFSGIMTMMAAKSKAQADFMKAALQQQKSDNEHQVSQLKADKGFSFTRRVIALTVVGVTGLVILAPAFFNVPTIVETVLETEQLFGLFSNKEVIHTVVDGFILPEWWSTAFTSIIGLYFGHSMTK